MEHQASRGIMRVVLSLKDGGSLDSDNTVNGQIANPGGFFIGGRAGAKVVQVPVSSPASNIVLVAAILIIAMLRLNARMSRWR